MVRFKKATIFLFVLVVTGCVIRIHCVDRKTRVSDLCGAVRWTDSRYLASGTVSDNAVLSQWPYGHDVRLRADKDGKITVTKYPHALRLCDLVVFE